MDKTSLIPQKPGTNKFLTKKGKKHRLKNGLLKDTKNNHSLELKTRLKQTILNKRSNGLPEPPSLNNFLILYKDNKCSPQLNFSKPQIETRIPRNWEIKAFDSLDDNKEPKICPPFDKENGNPQLINFSQMNRIDDANNKISKELSNDMIKTKIPDVQPLSEFIKSHSEKNELPQSVVMRESRLKKYKMRRKPDALIDKLERVIPCPYCPKMFKRNAHVASHIRVSIKI